jgi:hypothetical protein
MLLNLISMNSCVISQPSTLLGLNGHTISWRGRSSDLVNTILLLFGDRVLPVLTELRHHHHHPPRLWLIMQSSCSRCSSQLKTRSLLPVQSRNLWILLEAQGWIEMPGGVPQFQSMRTSHSV